jgi:hypothetical protein
MPRKASLQMIAVVVVVLPVVLAQVAATATELVDHHHVQVAQLITNIKLIDKH